MQDTRTIEQRRKDADALHVIEGNPLTDEDKRFLEQLDREGLSPEECHRRINALFTKENQAAE